MFLKFKPALRLNHAHTYSSCTHPLHQDSRGRRRSAVWRAGTDHSNTGNVQLYSYPEAGQYQVPQRNTTLRQTGRHSPALRHTSSSLGYTERSTHTGTGPHHRSEAGALLVLR